MESFQGYIWGVLVGINLAKYDVGSFKQGDFMIQMNLWDKVNKVKWNLLVVYGAAQEEHKFEFLSKLARFYDANSDPILIYKICKGKKFQ
jgi:hypothetical protein